MNRTQVHCSSHFCPTGLWLILMFAMLSVNRAERTNSQKGWNPPEHSESNHFFLPLCVNLGSKHLESVQHEKARRAFSTCATGLQIHLMHWKGCGSLLRYSESYDEHAIDKWIFSMSCCLITILMSIIMSSMTKRKTLLTYYWSFSEVNPSAWKSLSVQHRSSILQLTHPSIQ